VRVIMRFAYQGVEVPVARRARVRSREAPSARVHNATPARAQSAKLPYASGSPAPSSRPLTCASG
jgi:hypothetical protein